MLQAPKKEEKILGQGTSKLILWTWKQKVLRKPKLNNPGLGGWLVEVLRCGDKMHTHGCM